MRKLKKRFDKHDGTTLLGIAATHLVEYADGVLTLYTATSSGWKAGSAIGEAKLGEDVDGFRMDAIKHLVEEGKAQENTPSTHKWLQKNFYPAYKSANPEALAVGELFGNDMNSIGKYVNNQQFDMAFNFQLASSFISSANAHSASYAARALELSGKILENTQYAPFLTNHDQDRVLSQLGGDVNKAKVAASLLLTSPGAPFLYYGEEIGMTGMKPDENIRRPMQWSDAENAGFTTGKPWRAPDSGYTQVNVAAQTDDPASLLSHYRTLIQLRNAHPALRTGTYLPVQTDANRLFASLRLSKDEAVLVLINVGEETIRDYKLDFNGTPFASGRFTLSALMGMDGDLNLSAQPVPSLAPFTTYIFQIK